MRVVLLALVGCTAASSDPGVGELIRIQGAQFRPGPFPADEGGPLVTRFNTTHAAITIGTFRERLDGRLENQARAAVIGLDGYDDTWLVVPGLPDFDAPGSPTVKSTLGLDLEFPPGPFVLKLAAA